MPLTKISVSVPIRGDGSGLNVVATSSVVPCVLSSLDMSPSSRPEVELSEA